MALLQARSRIAPASSTSVEGMAAAFGGSQTKEVRNVRGVLYREDDRVSAMILTGEFEAFFPRG